jgi:DNA mismatch endonuclease (patch repair protein)
VAVVDPGLDEAVVGFLSMTAFIPPTPDGSGTSWASSPGVRRTMQGNRKFDSKPELRLRSALHHSGLRFFVHRRPHPSVSCKVDIVFPRAKLAVFVDGCFWHGCAEHGTKPRVHSDWWLVKLARNEDRDRRNDAELNAVGWRVLRIWEHEDIQSAVQRIRNELTGIRNEVARSDSCKEGP